MELLESRETEARGFPWIIYVLGKGAWRISRAESRLTYSNRGYNMSNRVLRVMGVLCLGSIAGGVGAREVRTDPGFEVAGSSSFAIWVPDDPASSAWYQRALGLRELLHQEWHPPAAWTEGVDPFPIADDLYYVGTAGLASYLVTSEEGHVLIDAPMRENTQLVLSNIRRLGFEPSDIRVQVATHAHFDHVGGVSAMLEVTGAELVLSEYDGALVAGGGGPGALSPYPPARADRIIGHLEAVTVGDRTLTAHLTPGHTRGCTSWSGVVEVGGDPLTFVLVCSLTVLPDYRLVGDEETYPGIARDYCSSAAHLRTLEPDIFLANHGEFMGLAGKIRALAAGDQRAFVDPASYSTYLDRAEAAIERALEELGHEGGCAAILEAPGTVP